MQVDAARLGSADPRTPSSSHSSAPWVVPALLRRVVTIGPAHVGLSTAITGLALSGFAPYPVMDLPAVVCVAVGVLLLCEVRWWSWILGGGCLAAAVNLRPAYVLPAVLILAVVAIVRWPPAPLGVVGAAAITGVQAMYGHVRADVWSASPPLADLVRTVQYQYGAYGVRYDTIPFTNGDPRLWHCSPGMADAMRGQPMPTSASGLLGVMVDNLPTSAGLAMDKFTASLHWSTATPYSHPGEQALASPRHLRHPGQLRRFRRAGGVASKSYRPLGTPRARGDDTRGSGDPRRLPSPEPRCPCRWSSRGPPASLPPRRGGAIATCRGRGHSSSAWGPPCSSPAWSPGSGWRALQQDVPRGDLTVEVCQQA